MKIEELGKKNLEYCKKIYTDEEPLGDELARLVRFKQNWVVFAQKYFPYRFLSEIAEMVGEDMAGECLYKFGYGCGRDIGRRYLTILGSKNEPQSLENVFKSTIFFAWGVSEVPEESEEKAILRVYNSFEAKSYLYNEEKSSRPICYFFKGVAAGIFSVAYNKEAEAVERKCLAMGDKYCEFIIAPIL